MRAMHKWAIVGLAACSDAGNFTPIPPDLDVPGPDPVVASVALTPEAPCTTDPIVATVSGGQPVSFSWTVDGRPSPVDGAVVGSDLTTRDQSWAVSVLVDGAPVAIAASGRSRALSWVYIDTAFDPPRPPVNTSTRPTRTDEDATCRMPSSRSGPPMVVPEL
jgi:hypothetical protein